MVWFRNAVVCTCTAGTILINSQSLAAGFTDYDIAIQELNQVKKKPARKVHSPRRAQHRREKKSAETAPATASRSGEFRDVQSAPLQRQDVAATSAEPVPAGAEKSLSVTHDPFSYLVAGRRSLVQAVVETDNGAAGVQCRFRADNSPSWGRVPMKLVEGTRFTYRGMLPAAVQSATMVQYQFIAVDREGKEILSREYTVPVRSSLVVPGWQLEPTRESLSLTLENGTDLLEGFSDPGIPAMLP